MAPLPTTDPHPLETGRGLPLSGWLLLVVLTFATIEQGAFHGAQFRLVLLLLLVAALALFATNRKAIDWRPVPALAAVAYGTIGVAVLATDADLRSAAPTLGLVTVVLSAIAVVHALDDFGVERVVDGLVVCGLIASATAWVGVAFHREPWGLVVQGIWRGSSTLTYANATAALAGVAFLLAIGRIRPSAQRLAFLPAYGLGVGVLCAGSRAGWLSVAVGLAVLARRTGWTTTAKALVPVSVGGVVAGLGLLPSIPADGPARPGLAVAGVLLGAAVVPVLSPGGRRADRPLRWSSVLLVAAGVTVVAASGWSAVQDIRAARFDLRSEDRAAEWSAAAEEFRTSPVVGVGPGRLDLSWVDPAGLTNVAEFAHNEYLELLATHGLVGLGALAAGGAIVAAHRRSRVEPSVVDDGVLAALTVLAVHSGFDFLWHIPGLALVGGVLVGLLARAPTAGPPAAALVPDLVLREGESLP